MKTTLFYVLTLVGLLMVEPAIAQQTNAIDSNLSKKFRAFKAAKNVEAKEQVFQNIKENFSPDQTKAASRIFESMYSDLVVLWFKNKDMDKYTYYAQKVDNKWRLYSGVLGTLQSWNKKHKNLDLSRKACQKILQDMAVQQEEGANSYNAYMHALFLDTYAQTLQALGNREQALIYYRQASDTYKRMSPDFALRYAAILSTDDQDEKAFDVLSSSMKSSMYNEDITAALKRLYCKTHSKMTGYTGYVASLQDSAFKRAHTEMLDKKIDTTRTAPDFKLKNLKGETVSLEQMRGKVVVDFWPTWCGPCKASFPGMQLAMHEYKNDPDVIFLYVDTYEQVENARKKVQAFMNKKGYPFEVLLDNQNDVAKKFGVSLIPNKFVIDKQGNILFEFAGFSGTDASVRNHVKAMIEIGVTTF